MKTIARRSLDIALELILILFLALAFWSFGIDSLD